MKMFDFKNLNIRKKLFLTYSVLIIIPLLLISIITYHYFSSYMEERIVNSFSELNKQLVTNTDAFLHNMQGITGSPFYDQTLLEVLSKDYEALEYPMYEKSRDYKFVVDSFFHKILLFYRDIDSIVIYANNNDIVYRKGYSVIYNYDYKPFDEAWFQLIQNKQGLPVVVGYHLEKQVSSNRAVMSVGQVIVDPSTYQKLGTIIVNFNESTLEGLFRGLNSDSAATQVIVDENDTILYNSVSRNIGQKFQDEIDIDGHEYHIVSRTSSISGWTFYTLIDKEVMFKEVYLIRQFILIIVAIIVSLAFLVAYLVSRSITTPIMQLSRIMRRFEMGDFNSSLQVKSQDEIGHLVQTFNSMTREIQLLIARIKEEEIEKRSAELNALQAQINPHFLYNTLTAIRWMSQAQMADNITETLDSLIYLLTFSARNTKEFVTVEEEMMFIKQYVSVLELRYFNLFDVKYEVDEEVLHVQTLKFILQPIVENAIFHGFIDESRKYQLRITARSYEQGVKLTVEDNGTGMSQEQRERLMQAGKESRGMNSIGIRNVAERLQLYYGDQYGIRIDSLPGEGTTVEVDIPRRIEMQTELLKEVIS